MLDWMEMTVHGAPGPQSDSDVLQQPSTSRLFTVSVIQSVAEQLLQQPAPCTPRRHPAWRAIAAARHFRTERTGHADTPLNNARACHTKPFARQRSADICPSIRIHFCLLSYTYACQPVAL